MRHDEPPGSYCFHICYAMSPFSGMETKCNLKFGNCQKVDRKLVVSHCRGQDKDVESLLDDEC